MQLGQVKLLVKELFIWTFSLPFTFRELFTHKRLVRMEEKKKEKKKPLERKSKSKRVKKTFICSPHEFYRGKSFIEISKERTANLFGFFSDLPLLELEIAVTSRFNIITYTSPVEIIFGNGNEINKIGEVKLNFFF